MVDEPKGLSPDLEWMLQSPQVSRAVLAEALVEVFYPRLYHLAFALLDDEGAAAAAVSSTLRAALDRRDSFRSEAELWVHRLALEACSTAYRRKRLKGWLIHPLSRPGKPYRFGSSIPASDQDIDLWETFDALDESQRLHILLHSLLNWPVSKIARLFGKNEAQVQKELFRAKDRLAGSLNKPPGDEPGSELPGEFDLHSSLERRWPAHITNEDEIALLSAEAAKELHPKRMGRFRQVITSFQEILWIWVIILLALAIVWGSNRLLSEPPLSQGETAAPTKTQTPAVSTPNSGGQPPAKTQQPAKKIPTATLTPPFLIDYYARTGDTLRSIAARLGVSPEELHELNHLSLDEELQEGRSIQVPLPSGSYATPTPVTPVLHHLPALSPNAASDDIYSYLLLSERLWQTLWADVSLIDYGPAGYVGKPLVARIQVWVAQPGQGRELIGPAGNQPRYDILVRDQRIYYQTTGNLPPNPSWTVQEIPNPLQYFQTYNQVFPGHSTLIRRDGRFRTAGIEKILDREALIADWFDRQGIRRSRLWIDTRTGVLLKSQKFAEPDGITLQSESFFTSVQIDANFPAAVFDPRLGGRVAYAQDSTGRPDLLVRRPPPDSTAAGTTAPGHKQLALVPAPSGFDPSSSPLTFQYLTNPTGASQPSEGGDGVDLFAGRYYLGSLDLPDPHSFQCDRSADGQWLALLTQGNWLNFTEEMDAPDLVLLNLHDLAGLRRVVPDLYPSDFAFAPDSRRLAVSGFNRFSQGAEVDVFEIETNTINQVLTVNGYIHGLVWSPDGQYLALVGAVEDARVQEAFVIRVQDGQIVYRTPVADSLYTFDLSELQEDPDWPAPDWPVREWGVKFPILERDLGICAQAPK